MPNALDSFLELEKEGKTYAEIVSELQEKGFSPQEINDAINQSRIKKAVVSPEGMQPSIMQTTSEQEQPEIPVPVPIKKKRMQQAAAAQNSALVYPPQETAQPSAEYQYPAQVQTPYDYGYQPATQGAAQGVDVETIEEICEEIVNEKMIEFKNKIEDIGEFKQMIQSRLGDFDERLKRIEANIDRLQAALIGRVQEYGQNIKDLGSEMRAVEGAFSKILNPLVDNIKELNSITEKMKGKDKGK